VIKVKSVSRASFTELFLLFASFAIVALGQPARVGWLSAISAVGGFTLFFCTLSSSLKPKQRFLFAAIWFAAVQMVQLSWMTSTEFQGYYVIVVYSLIVAALGIQFGLFTLCIPSHGKISWGRICSLAALWTLFEWVRLFFFCGFSWNPVGLALTHFTPTLQCASLFGILGLSFLTMFTNLCGINAFRLRESRSIACWILIACFPYLFGFTHLLYHANEKNKETGKVAIALVQTALLPSEKIPYAERLEEFIPPLEQWRRIFISLREKGKTHWDFIVLPEAAVPWLSDLCFYPYETIRNLCVAELGTGALRKLPPLVYPYAQERNSFEGKEWTVSNLFLCQFLANHYQAEVVAGLDHTDSKSKKNFNSGFHLSPSSVAHGRYDKQVLLPLAEYLPFEVLRPLTKSYGIFDFFSPGEGVKVFGKKIPFSMAICYEETFAEVMRQAKNQGAGLFINLTNDNYYPDSKLHEQHFYHARVRTVENGVPLVRACNAGVTAAVDSSGQILARLDTQGRQEAALGCYLTPYRYSTLFSFWGEAAIISLSLLCLLSYYRLKI